MEGKKISERQLQAQKYLDEYDIQNVVGEMLNSLLHEKDQHPYVYMIKYLASLMTEDERKEFNLSIPEPYPSAHPVVRFPKFAQTCNNLLKQTLTEDKFKEVKKVKTKYGNNINSVTKLSEVLPEDEYGVVLTDGDCLNVYKNFLQEIIDKVHHIKTESQHDYKTHLFQTLSPSDCFGLDELKPNLNKVIMSYSRNITENPINHFSCGVDKLVLVEGIIEKEINAKIADSTLSVFQNMKKLTFKDNKDEIENILQLINYDVKWYEASGLNQRYPEHRIIFTNESKSLIILVNFSNHLEIFSVSNKDNMDLVQSFNNLVEALKQLSLSLLFETHKTYGYVTSQVNLLGAGFNVITELTLNNISTITLQGCELDELIKGSKFDKYTLNKEEGKATLISSQSCKLIDSNEVCFIVQFFNKIAGISTIFNSNKQNELTFNHIDLPSFTNPKLALVKETYDSIFEEIKYLLSSRGTNINSLISQLATKDANSNDVLGVVFNDKSEYIAFAPFVREYLLKTQNFDTYTTDHIHKMEEPKEMTEIPEESLSKIKNLNICIFRNIEGLPFAVKDNNERENIENSIKKTIEEINTKGHFADYISKAENKDKYTSLVTENNLLITDTSDEDKFKGAIKFEKENVYGIVNDIDHLKFYLHLNEPKGKLGSPLVALLKEMNEIAKHIKLSYDNKLGFITSSPFFLGTGILLKMKLCFNTLTMEDIKDTLDAKEFEVIEEKKEGDKLEVTIANKITIGESETELFTNLLVIIKDLLEDDSN